jgi:hypothetical protein
MTAGKPGNDGYEPIKNNGQRKKCRDPAPCIPQEQEFTQSVEGD